MIAADLFSVLASSVSVARVGSSVLLGSSGYVVPQCFLCSPVVPLLFAVLVQSFLCPRGLPYLHLLLGVAAVCLMLRLLLAPSSP